MILLKFNVLVCLMCFFSIYTKIPPARQKWRENNFKQKVEDDSVYTLEPPGRSRLSLTSLYLTQFPR